MKNPNREHWNEQQKQLQYALARPADHQRAVELFLSQHAMVHTADMAGAGLWSFEDEIWPGLTAAQIRYLPSKGEHSLAWVFWHLARIEDVTMNILVAGCPQLLQQDGWLERLKIPNLDTGNAMSLEAITTLSAVIDLDALRHYRRAVGRRTREIVQRLTPADLKKKVDPQRIQQIRDQGAVVEAASEILDYWSKRTLAGLLLMPPTRHNFLHLNEALRLKRQCR